MKRSRPPWLVPSNHIWNRLNCIKGATATTNCHATAISATSQSIDSVTRPYAYSSAAKGPSLGKLVRFQVKHGAKLSLSPSPYRCRISKFSIQSFQFFRNLTASAAISLSSSVLWQSEVGQCFSGFHGIIEPVQPLKLRDAGWCNGNHSSSHPSNESSKKCRLVDRLQPPYTAVRRVSTPS